jgi:hypothetical protein
MGEPEFGPLTRLVSIHFPPKTAKATWSANVTLNVGSAAEFGPGTPALCWGSLVSLDSHGNVVGKDGPTVIDVTTGPFNDTYTFSLVNQADSLTLALQITMNVDAYQSNLIGADARNVFNLYVKGTHTSTTGKKTTTYNVTSVPVVVFNPAADGGLGNGNLGPVFYHNADFGDILQWASPLAMVVGNPTFTVADLGFGAPVTGP